MELLFLRKILLNCLLKLNGISFLVFNFFINGKDVEVEGDEESDGQF